MIIQYMAEIPKLPNFLADTLITRRTVSGVGTYCGRGKKERQERNNQIGYEVLVHQDRKEHMTVSEVLRMFVFTPVFNLFTSRSVPRLDNLIERFGVAHAKLIHGDIQI